MSRALWEKSAIASESGGFRPVIICNIKKDKKTEVSWPSKMIQVKFSLSLDGFSNTYKLIHDNIFKYSEG